MTALAIKSSPLDIETFRHETSVKYPTFTPVQHPVPQVEQPTVHSRFQIQTSKLAQAYSPIPVRHHYHHDDSESQHPNPHSNPHNHPFHQQAPSAPYRPQPPTPAPSPPASPKPKKQQYQTDQNRPFLFPFSAKSRLKDGKLVPFAIDEADKLFNKHMYVSVALWQMWKTREECMTVESGLDHMPGSEGDAEPVTVPIDVSVIPSDCLPPISDICYRIRKLENLY